MAKPPQPAALQAPAQQAKTWLCVLFVAVWLSPPAPDMASACTMAQLQEQNLVANKALLLSHGLLGTLLALGLEEGGVSSAAVRVQVGTWTSPIAWMVQLRRSLQVKLTCRLRNAPCLPSQAIKCVAALVEGDEANQERLGSASVKLGKQDLPALQVWPPAPARNEATQDVGI